MVNFENANKFGTSRLCLNAALKTCAIWELTVNYLLKNKIGKLLITDIVGKIIYEADLSATTFNTNIKLNVAAGTYICKLLDGTDTKVVKWIVIK
jgi:hypothetical protein